MPVNQVPNPYRRAVNVHVICRMCRRKVRGYVCVYGDGQLATPYRHGDKNGMDCDGVYLDSTEFMDGE